jgi:hypothetical protein
VPVRDDAGIRGGYFAAFHVYPYYPDFLVHEPVYGSAESPYGRSAYFGYLQDLKRHFPGVPLVIAEYGVPVSWGIAHFNPQGWHHGGHTEQEMAAINARLTREIAAAGHGGRRAVRLDGRVVQAQLAGRAAGARPTATACGGTA